MSHSHITGSLTLECPVAKSAEIVFPCAIRQAVVSQMTGGGRNGALETLDYKFVIRYSAIRGFASFSKIRLGNQTSEFLRCFRNPDTARLKEVVRMPRAILSYNRNCVRLIDTTPQV